MPPVACAQNCLALVFGCYVLKALYLKKNKNEKKVKVCESLSRLVTTWSEKPLCIQDYLSQ